MNTKKTSRQKYDAFHSLKIPASLKDQWVAAEDEGRDNASHTEHDGKLMGYVPQTDRWVEAFVDTVAFVSVASDGYTNAFRKWLEKCGIVG